MGLVEAYTHRLLLKTHQLSLHGLEDSFHICNPHLWEREREFHHLRRDVAKRDWILHLLITADPLRVVSHLSEWNIQEATGSHTGWLALVSKRNSHWSMENAKDPHLKAHFLFILDSNERSIFSCSTSRHFQSVSVSSEISVFLFLSCAFLAGLVWEGQCRKNVVF